VESLKWIIEYLDYVLLLSVNPGFGGQDFIPNVLEKAGELSSMIEATGKEILIQADGGINADTIHQFSQAGVNNFVLGSALFDSPDYSETIRQLRRSIDLVR
jgi:ribulose-phosphate 3-epimerase